MTLLFGGRAVDALANPVGPLLHDTWDFDGEAWVKRSEAGPVLDSLAIAYDSVRDRTVLVGATGINGVDFETWEWDGASWTPVCQDAATC